MASPQKATLQKVIQETSAVKNKEINDALTQPEDPRYRPKRPQRIELSKGSKMTKTCTILPRSFFFRVWRK